MKYPIQFCRPAEPGKKPVWIGQMTLDDERIDKQLIQRVKYVASSRDPKNREVVAYNLQTKQYV